MTELVPELDDLRRECHDMGPFNGRTLNREQRIVYAYKSSLIALIASGDVYNADPNPLTLAGMNEALTDWKRALHLQVDVDMGVI